MTDIIGRISEALGHLEQDGRTPARVLIGHREAAELERALYRRAKTWRGLFGDVIAEDPEFAPKLPLDMGPARIFGVPVKRVDQDTLLGVVAEGFEEALR